MFWCFLQGNRLVYGAKCTLKKLFYYVIMPKVVTKGYKIVITRYEKTYTDNKSPRAGDTLF